MHLRTSLENLPKLYLITLGLLLVLIVERIDALLNPEFSLSIFYLIPVSLTTWFGGQVAGTVISAVSAIAWFMGNQPSREILPFHPAVIYWNTIVGFGFFLTTTWLLFHLRCALEREKNLARTDYVTGAHNRRAFYEFTNLEIKRALRYGHPLTIAYIDIDDFKTINDRLGHGIGDRLLKKVATTISNYVRETDIIARMGGDEFVLLLPGTGYEPSQIVLERVQERLKEMMEEQQWHVTFSIGAITFMSQPASIDEMLEKADYVMYTVKNSGKNRLEHKIQF